MAGEITTPKRVVRWDGFKPGDTDTTASHTMLKSDWKVLLGPDTKAPEVVFERDNGFFAEVDASETEMLEWFEKSPHFTVKPLAAK